MYIRPLAYYQYLFNLSDALGIIFLSKILYNLDLSFDLLNSYSVMSYKMLTFLITKMKALFTFKF